MKEIRYTPKNIEYPCGCSLHVTRHREPFDCCDDDCIRVESYEICDEHSEFAIEQPRCDKCKMPFDTWKETKKCKHESIVEVSTKKMGEFISKHVKKYNCECKNVGDVWKHEKI